MELLNLNIINLKSLSNYKSIIEENVDFIIDKFYEKQTDIEEISLLIGDIDTLKRLKVAQHKYIMDLFSGHYDSEYVNSRLRIGMVHKRIGVEPKLYLSAVRILKELVSEVLENLIEDKKELSSTLDILDKLLYFDTTLVFDTYIESLVGEIKTAKSKTEVYAQSLEKKVTERTKQLEEQAKIDPLTKLYNQRAMYESLRREILTAKRRQTKLSFIYFDIDKFKYINDTFGHIKGDEVLRSIGDFLNNSIRETDIACRYGGDEFCVILPECDISNARVICEKLIEKFSLKYPDYSISIGISETGIEDYLDESQIIKDADKKMYLAKKTEGFKICF